MNRLMMAAFCDELEKIADWSLTGDAIPQIPSEQIKQQPMTEAPLGVTPELQSHIQAKEQAIRAQEHAAEQHAARMSELVQSGKLNLSTHTLDRAGNIVPKKPLAMPRTEAPTRITPPPLAPTGEMGPEGTNVLAPTGTPDKRLASHSEQPRQPTQVTRTQAPQPTQAAMPTQATQAHVPAGAASQTTRVAPVIQGPPPAAAAAKGGTSIIRRATAGASRAPGKLGLLGKGAIGLAALGGGAMIGRHMAKPSNQVQG
jgi:hypothetical protein